MQKEKVEKTKSEIYKSLGLTDNEYDLIVQHLNREPNDLELAMFSVMWSEHCSYKSSRIHLKRLPTKADNVLVGPGENAGVIDAGDNLAVALRIESHNHPSAIEPTQGAATGAGGILRDIFTVGARPIALLDPLYVGPLEDPKHRWHLEGIVRGISNYGNSVGVPTVGGEIHFDSCYSGNPLVNVGCVGILEKDKLVLGVASGAGNLAILLGSSTGKDGIGGVSVLASASFEEESSDTKKLPSVQVGDPYEEKRLIEACLELINKNLVVGIQDLGGAGLTCATSETAARANLGMDVDISQVKLREADMSPIEIMTSESQERMLAIVTKDNLADVNEICRKWEINASVVGVVTEQVNSVGYLRVFDGFGTEPLAIVPAKSLADEAPLYDREQKAPKTVSATDENFESFCSSESVKEFVDDLKQDLIKMLVKPEWIYRQYDHQLFLNTIIGPGNGSSLLRLAIPGSVKTDKGIAITTDGNPKWCAIDPYMGTYLTVVEAITNIAVTGSIPQAVINCLNFGSPENPEVMWQFSKAVDGLKAACEDFNLAVVGGNVSFYNSTNEVDIDPTPVIGVVGIHPDIKKAKKLNSQCLESDDFKFYLLNGPDVLEESQKLSVAGSKWATQIHNTPGGKLPEIDLDETLNFVTSIPEIVRDFTSGLIQINDIGDGGLIGTLAEMIISFNSYRHNAKNLNINETYNKTNTDFDQINTKYRGYLGVELIEGLSINSLFSEMPGRAIVQVKSSNAEEFNSLLKKYSIKSYYLGSSVKDKLILNSSISIEIAELLSNYERSLESYMS